MALEYMYIMSARNLNLHNCVDTVTHPAYYTAAHISIEDTLDKKATAKYHDCMNSPL